MDVYIDGKRYQLTPAKSVGKGGEADIYDIGGGMAVKLFKQPDHPDFDGDPVAQRAAELRLKQHQTKLLHFPKNLPPRVRGLDRLVTNKSGSEILGYSMRFLSNMQVLLHYSEQTFRKAGVPNEAVTRIFRDLHTTVGGIHAANVVIGDFNDLNILVAHHAEANIIDSDSFQFGQYLCTVFTARFVDPILCDPRAHSLNLVKPHNALSDWYAFNVMLMQCLLYVGPYGGVYKPKDPAKRIAHDARPLQRITVFNPEVRYPKPATRYDVLSDDLLHHFHQVFERDERRPFPAQLLEMQWTTCSKCGLEFSRRACPVCATPAPGQVKQTIRSKVTCTNVFETSGRIHYATVQDGKIRYLYNEKDQFIREDNSVVTTGSVGPKMRFRIQGKKTLIAQGQRLVTFQPGEKPQQTIVDTFSQIPVFDANRDARFWVANGALHRDGVAGPEVMGQVVQDQTMFWVGEKLGFGFYRAGKLSVAFTFHTDDRGINDTIKLPPIKGQQHDSTCYFASDRIWFAVSFQEAGVLRNRMIALRPNGTVEGVAETTAGDGSWLGSIRGKTAAGSYLFAATDDGIVRVEVDYGKIGVTKEFPDTEAFVDAGCHLFPGSQGLYVVSPREIKLLQLK